MLMIPMDILALIAIVGIIDRFDESDFHICAITAALLAACNFLISLNLPEKIGPWPTLTAMLVANAAIIYAMLKFSWNRSLLIVGLFWTYKFAFIMLLTEMMH